MIREDNNGTLRGRTELRGDPLSFLLRFSVNLKLPFKSGVVSKRFLASEIVSGFGVLHGKVLAGRSQIYLSPKRLCQRWMWMLAANH